MPWTGRKNPLALLAAHPKGPRGAGPAQEVPGDSKMTDRGRHIDALVSGLSGVDRENAWHSLAELGPVVAPDVIATLQTVDEPTVATALIRLLAEYRSPEAIPVLAGRLRDPERDVWQAALDALVTIGTVQSAEALTAAATM